MDIRVEADNVNVDARNGSKVAVEISGVGESEVLDHFNITEIFDHFDHNDIAEELRANGYTVEDE